MHRYRALLFLCIISSVLYGTTHTNKTYQALRPTQSFYFAEPTRKIQAPHETQSGSSLSLTPYFRCQKDRPSYYGNYFGASSQAELPALGKIVAAPPTQPTSHGTYGYYIDHRPLNVSDALQGEALLAPSFSLTGFVATYHQNLSFFIPDLYLELQLPFEHAKTHILKRIDNATSTPEGYTMLDYLEGRSLEKTGADAQEPLNAAQMWLSKNRPSYGIGDLSAELGYHLVATKHAELSCFLKCTIPCGTRSEGVCLFEAIHGNGGHVATSIGVTGARTWQHERITSLRGTLSCSAHYRYTFTNTQMRTLGIYNHLTSSLLPAGPYYVLGTADNIIGVPSAVGIPAANVLTQECAVTPGSSFATSLQARVDYENFFLSYRFGLFMREAEHVALRNTWQEGRYGILAKDASPVNVSVGSDYSTVGGPLQAQGNSSDAQGVVLGANNPLTYYVTTDACATPAAIVSSHSIESGYTFFAHSDHATTLSCGYEIEETLRQSNAAIPSVLFFVACKVIF